MPRASVVQVREGVRVDAHVLRYVEEELRGHRARQRAIEARKAAIARARPVVELGMGGGRPSGSVGDPTHSAVARILQDEELQRWETRTKLVDAGLATLVERERRVVDMLYITRRYQPCGVAMELGITDRQVRRIKNEALYTLALTLGIVS